MGQKGCLNACIGKLIRGGTCSMSDGTNRILLEPALSAPVLLKNQVL